ncbi:phage scaffolding protein [Thermoactinomyces sp. DSM 45892]|uniref:phage scaffolding protein n=1 Tax=Thermoactinomyces sp. DSM 45892 TaxID=1882753 RepID=UPI00089A7FEA|nr:phage scaffolding protein [Thermoactinomyces sp. DSM 45892]SDZ00827.1 Phage minor structural protein GP20 [Thermoactinomyces sp. DSM 45892]
MDTQEQSKQENQQLNTYDEKYIKSLRDETKKYKDQVKDIQKQFDGFKQSIHSQLGLKTDSDLEQHIQQWKEKANESLLKAEVKSIATDLGIVDSDAAFALMDREGLEIAEDGSVKGVREVLDVLVQSKPYLVKQVDQGEVMAPTKGGQAFQEGGNKRITREDLKRMKPEEVNQALASGELNHLLNR